MVFGEKNSRLSDEAISLCIIVHGDEQNCVLELDIAEMIKDSMVEDIDAEPYEKIIELEDETVLFFRNSCLDQFIENRILISLLYQQNKVYEGNLKPQLRSLCDSIKDSINYQDMTDPEPVYEFEDEAREFLDSLIEQSCNVEAFENIPGF